ALGGSQSVQVTQGSGEDLALVSNAVDLSCLGGGGGGADHRAAALGHEVGEQVHEVVGNLWARSGAGDLEQVRGGVGDDGQVALHPRVGLGVDVGGDDHRCVRVQELPGAALAGARRGHIP